jgi:hypothetical protein
MTLGLTQSLTEMSTRHFSWVKGNQCIGLTTLPPSCANCLEIWELQPPGILRACPDLYWDYFYIYIYIKMYIFKYIILFSVLYFLVEKLPKEKFGTLTLTMRRNFLHHGEPLPIGAKEHLTQHYPGTNKCVQV